MSFLLHYINLKQTFSNSKQKFSQVFVFILILSFRFYVGGMDTFWGGGGYVGGYVGGMMVRWGGVYIWGCRLRGYILWVGGTLGGWGYVGGRGVHTLGWVRWGGGLLSGGRGGGAGHNAVFGHFLENYYILAAPG